MKKLSIKLRITLWYTLLMILIVASVLIFMVFISKQITTTDTKNSLLKIVNQNLEEVEYDDDQLEIDDDFIYMQNGVTSLIYSQKNELLGGYLQSALELPNEFEDGQIQTVDINGESYYVYDRLLSFKKNESVWVRGYVKTNNESSVIQSIITAAMWLFPLIIIIAALVGYLITKHSFKPVNKMIASVNAISEGKDLSERIEIGKGEDEIHQLGDTFNAMFERLETAFKKEKQFTSDVSHELRTPLSVILNQCDYTLETRKTVEDYELALGTIQRQATRMSQLTSQLLSFTRLENGVEKLDVEQTDFSELLTAICEEQQDISDSSPQLIYDIQPDIFLSIDSMMMIRVIVNLLNNARQYSKPDGHIWFELKRKDTSAYLTIKDDGIGIESEHLPFIWDRFYQVDSSRSKNQEGTTGLGLAFVKQIIELHDGEITMSSVFGEGSTFTIKFPIN